MATMSTKSVVESIVERERGTPWKCSMPISYLRKREWKPAVLLTQKSISLGRNRPVTYIRGRNDSFFCVVAHIDAYFCVPSSGLFLPLLKPGEHVKKLIVTDPGAYIFVQRGAETSLRVYLLSSEVLRTWVLKRERVLREFRLTSPCLKQVDSKYKRIVIQDKSTVCILDIPTETIIYKGNHIYGVNAWYSRNHLILGKFSVEGAVFLLRDLDSTAVRGLRARNALDVFHIEIIPNKLVIACRNKPVIVISLNTPQLYTLNKSPAKYYLETEKLEDVCVIEQNGNMRFAGNKRKFSMNKSSVPLFTDTEDTLILYDAKVLNVLHHSGELISTIKVLKTGKVTAIGMNEDNGEIYVGYKNGKVLVLN